MFLPIASLGLFLGSLGFVFLVERDTVPFGSSDETRRRSPRIVRGLSSLDGGSHLRIWGVEDGTCLLDPPPHEASLPHTLPPRGLWMRIAPWWIEWTRGPGPVPYRHATEAPRTVRRRNQHHGVPHVLDWRGANRKEKEKLPEHTWEREWLPCQGCNGRWTKICEGEGKTKTMS